MQGVGFGYVLPKGLNLMGTALTAADLDNYTARLAVELEREGWEASEEQLRSFVGLLPLAASPDAAVVTDTEAAFVLGDSLLVASWQDSDEHLVTDVFSLAGTPLTIVWNADWLAEYGLGPVGEESGSRPMTVTMRAQNGAAYVLPFDEAWTNPAGCINFVNTLIHKAHGFRPAVGTELDTSAPRAWKR